MIFDSSNEAASYELSLDEMRKNPDINWYLWRLDAQNEEDTADFTQFASLLKKQPNGEVPLSLLTEWGIGLTRSRIVRNLLREKLAATTDKELQLTFPRIDSDNIDSWETKLSEYYHSNAQTERMKILRFPSSYFCLIDRSVCVTVPVQNLGWYSFDTPSYEHKLIEITFPRFHIPPVMVTATAIEELILTAKEKIIYKLSQTAAENNGFFSRYVKFDGFSIKNRFPTPFEADLISLKNKKGQDYQFGYTQIFLDKVFAKPETAAEYMDAVNFESYSDLSVLFSPSKRENYDFIQSYLIYKELVLPLNHTQKEATEKLNTALAGALRFYMTEDEIIKANVMVQIAVNKAMKIDAPRYNRKKLEELLPYILEETINEKAFYPFLREAFRHAGVVFIAVPNMPGSTIIGAVRRVNEKMLMMMNGKRMNADVFWFTIFHEIGHILNGDYGITVEHEAMENDPEYEADRFAEKMLIPENEYKDFVENNVFTMKTIKEFASSIKRNPSIVLGQLERDGIIKTDDSRFSALRRKYRIEDEDDSKQA